MPDDAILEGALRSVARRLRIDRALRVLADSAAALAALSLLALVASRTLPGPAATALAILLSLCAIAVVCAALWRFVVGPRVALVDAAAHADTRAGLADLLSTGWWFTRTRASDPWIDAARGRAVAAARALDPARVAPIHAPRSGIALVVLAALCGVVGSVAPRADALSDAVGAADTTRRAMPRASAVETLREMAAEAARRGDRTAQAQLGRALAVLEDPDATPDQQRRALEEVQAMVGQRNLDAAAQVEGLQQVADALASNAAFKDVAAALKAGDARGAADALRKLQDGEQGGRNDGPGNDGDAGGTRPLVDDLKAALQDATYPASPQSGGDAGATAGKLQKAIDKLDELAKRLDTAGNYNQGQRKLAQQSMAMEGFAQQDATRAGNVQGKPDSGNSPETGNANMSGGTMYRNPDPRRADPSNQPGPASEGAQGESSGEAAGDPVIGDEVAKVDARYRRERVEGMQSEGRDGPDTAFYAASRQSDSKIDVRVGAAAAARYAGEDALGRERIALRHRTQVKQYFTPGSEAK